MLYLLLKYINTYINNINIFNICLLSRLIASAAERDGAQPVAFGSGQCGRPGSPAWSGAFPVAPFHELTLSRTPHPPGLHSSGGSPCSREGSAPAFQAQVDGTGAPAAQRTHSTGITGQPRAGVTLTGEGSWEAQGKNKTTIYSIK